MVMWKFQFENYQKLTVVLSPACKLLWNITIRATSFWLLNYGLSSSYPTGPTFFSRNSPFTFIIQYFQIGWWSWRLCWWFRWLPYLQTKCWWTMDFLWYYVMGYWMCETRSTRSLRSSSTLCQLDKRTNWYWIFNQNRRFSIIVLLFRRWRVCILRIKTVFNTLIDSPCIRGQSFKLYIAR